MASEERGEKVAEFALYVHCYENDNFKARLEKYVEDLQRQLDETKAFIENVDPDITCKQAVEQGRLEPLA